MAVAPGELAGGESPALEIFSASSWVRPDESLRGRLTEGLRAGPNPATVSLVVALVGIGSEAIVCIGSGEGAAGAETGAAALKREAPGERV